MALFSWEIILEAILIYLLPLYWTVIEPSNWPTFFGAAAVLYIYHFFCLTYVKFYRKHIVIVHPLRLFWSKQTINVNEIINVDIDGRPPSFKIHCYNNKKSYSFTAPLSKIKTLQIITLLQQMGVDFDGKIVH